MDAALRERRRDTRFTHPGVTSARVTLRPGRIATLVNLSAGGALVQSPRPLRPGAQVHVLLNTDRRACSVNAAVLRCTVSMIDEQGVIYRGALLFEHRCDLFGESSTRSGYRMPPRTRPQTVDPGQTLPDEWPTAIGR